jgi:hypothetical protein
MNEPSSNPAFDGCGENYKAAPPNATAKAAKFRIGRNSPSEPLAARAAA